jgi:Protein of unknown function (DUF3800)
VLCAKSQADPWLRLMALIAYVDDSGSSPNEPVYVLGGLILPQETWDVFADDWRGVLQSPPSIGYFKASEVWDRTKGPFSQMTTTERSMKVKAFVDIVATYKPMSISCRVEWSVFNEFRESYKLEPELDDPYFLLYFGIIAQMVDLAREERFGKVNFIFDSQNQIGKNVNAWYLVFLNRCTEDVLRFLGTKWPEFGDEKKTVELQAADMFAWYQRRSALGSLGNEAHSKVWERLSSSHYSTVLDPSHLVSIATDLAAIVG